MWNVTAFKKQAALPKNRATTGEFRLEKRTLCFERTGQPEVCCVSKGMIDMFNEQVATVNKGHPLNGEMAADVDVVMQAMKIF